MKRRTFSPADETAILWESRRRCALCVYLDGDTSEKEGQIAHIDRDHSNSVRSNGAFLCTKHHPKYDSVSHQTKGLTPGELRKALAFMTEVLAGGATWPDSGGQRTRGPGVSLEVFDRRIPIYEATIAFIGTMTTGGTPELKDIFAFARQTEPALFLFGDAIAEYLAGLYKKAIRLRYVAGVIERPEARTPELTQEDMELLLWFSEQYEEVRRQFAPYLYIGKSAG